MKKISVSYAILFALFASFGVGAGNNLQSNPVKNLEGLNLICAPKSGNFDPIILSDFSTDSIYNYDEVRVRNAAAVLEFIPIEIRVDQNGIEIMKGEMVDHRGRRSYVEFKNSSKHTYDIYTPKNEWNCVSKVK